MERVGFVDGPRREPRPVWELLGVQHGQLSHRSVEHMASTTILRSIPVARGDDSMQRSPAGDSGERPPRTELDPLPLRRKPQDPLVRGLFGQLADCRDPLSAMDGHLASGVRSLRRRPLPVHHGPELLGRVAVVAALLVTIERLLCAVRRRQLFLLLLLLFIAHTSLPGPRRRLRPLLLLLPLLQETLHPLSRGHPALLPRHRLRESRAQVPVSGIVHARFLSLRSLFFPPTPSFCSSVARRDHPTRDLEVRARELVLRGLRGLLRIRSQRARCRVRPSSAISISISISISEPGGGGGGEESGRSRRRDRGVGDDHDDRDNDGSTDEHPLLVDQELVRTRIRSRRVLPVPPWPESVLARRERHLHDPEPVDGLRGPRTRRRLRPSKLPGIAHLPREPRVFGTRMDPHRTESVPHLLRSRTRTRDRLHLGAPLPLLRHPVVEHRSTNIVLRTGHASPNRVLAPPVHGDARSRLFRALLLIIITRRPRPIPVRRRCLPSSFSSFFSPLKTSSFLFDDHYIDNHPFLDRYRHDSYRNYASKNNQE